MTETMTAREAAIWFAHWCESRGGAITLDEHGIITATVDYQNYPVGRMTPEKFGIIVSALKDELRALIEAQRVTH